METKKQIDANEAPPGFYATAKNTTAENACNYCDARKLCQENKNEWCAKNRCMAYGVISDKTREIIQRKDGCSVVFKRQSQPQLEL